MREGPMSEVMAEAGEGNALNVSGGDTKLWLVLREMLDHCSREVCDTWKTLNKRIRSTEGSVRTQAMFESIV